MTVKVGVAWVSLTGTREGQDGRDRAHEWTLAPGRRWQDAMSFIRDTLRASVASPMNVVSWPSSRPISFLARSQSLYSSSRFLSLSLTACAV